MVRDVVGRIRERVDVGGIVPLLTITAAFSLLGFEVTRWDVVGSIVGVVILAPILGRLLDRFEIDPGLLVIALGLLVGWGGFQHLQHGTGWLGWPLLVLSGWLCLEGVDRWGRDEPTPDTGADDVSRDELERLGEQHRRLLAALRRADGPLTADEIRTRTGLSEDEFERLLEFHGDSGPIERVGTGYRLDERELGATGVLRTVGRRIRRPLRVLRPVRQG